MSTLMTTPTPGMVSPPAPFSLDAIRRQVLHRVDMPGLHKDEDDDEEDNTMAAATQDVGMNGDCEEEDAEDEGAEEGCSVGDAEGDADGDDEAPRQPSADDEPRRNKRKNFKPRNILYDEDNPQAPGAPAPGHGGGASDSDGDEQQHGLQHGLPHGMDADLAAAGILDAHGVKRRSRKPLFAPQKRYAAEEGGSPVPRFGALDLSAQGLQGGQQPENEDDSSAFGEDDDSRSSYPTLNHLNSGPEDESSDVNLSDGGGGGGVAPSVSMLSRNHLLKPRVQVRTHMERDRDSSSAADGDSSLDLSSSDGRLFGRQQVFGAPDASPRGPGSSSPSAEDALAADLSRARDLDGMLGAASPLGTMAAHMAAAAAFRRQGGAMGPEQNAMKEFAEKTMRELLGIYGIGAADFGEPLSGLPMANFASGKMLEALGGGALNLGLARAAAAQQRLSSPPSQPPTPPRTPLSPQQQQPATPQPPKSESPPQQSTGTPPQPSAAYPTPTPHQQQALAAALQAAGLTPAAGASTEFEDFRGKLAENMAKLTGLPATSIMNDPRVMLPQNLHTILTLAALQDQGIAAKAIRTPSMPMLDAKSGGLLQGMPSLAASGLGGVAGGVPGGVPAVPGVPGVPGPGVAAGKATAPIDYSRYVKRFSSALECGRAFCKDLNYREHFHCIECNSRVFVKKEEMIRHFKWHKKRAESLAHGFMRYSPNDDCSDRYRDCSHNRKQTHYHCIKENCDKVYISTSDVQMHANYHRKDSAIIQEGFQRYRATEECRTEYCVFFGQRTTHFHCRREGCKYTFKNKADMEKHKTYHIKDEQLTRDGFKKFMKQDPCPFEGCRFSGNCNHIHCIRSGCSYVLHSSGQLFSHKRKHERKDSELAYRKYKLAQSMMKSLVDGQAFADQFSAVEDVGALQSLMAGLGGQPAAPQPPPTHGADPADGGRRSLSPGQSQGGPNHAAPPPHPLLALQQHMPFRLGLDMLPPPYMLEGASSTPGDAPTDLTRSSPTLAGDIQASWHTPQAAPSAPQPPSQSPQQAQAQSLPDEALWQRVSWRFSPCTAERCGQAQGLVEVVPGVPGRGEHWHCRAEGCAMVLRAREGVLEHARNHDAQDQISEAHYVTVGGNTRASPSAGDGKCHCDQDCPYQDKEKHYHCTWDNCREIILPSDKPFRRLDHYKMHEYSRKLSQSRDPLTTMHLASSIDAMFRRKRGRPPKNRVIEVWNDYMSGAPGSSMPDTPQAIFTSFKLPKPSANAPAAPPPRPSPLQLQLQQQQPAPPPQGQQGLFGTAGSPPALNPAAATADDDAGQRASSPNTLELLQEGFMLFEQGEGSRCGDALCSLSGRRHFHCKQPRCFYATDREDVLLMHARDFHDNIDILPGFVFFDRSIDCRLPGCPSNRANRHFHCSRPACGYSFVRYSNMAQHEAKHRGEANNNNQDSDKPVADVLVLGMSAAMGTPHREMSPVGSGAGTMSPLAGTGGSTGSSHPGTPSPAPGTPRSRPPSTPQHLADQSRTTVVRASGTFYPLSALSCGSGGAIGGGSGSRPLAPLAPGTPSGASSAPAGGATGATLPKSSPSLPLSPTTPFPSVPPFSPVPGAALPTTPAMPERRHHFVADIVKTEPDANAAANAMAGSHSLARLLQHHAEAGAGHAGNAGNAMLPSPTASSASTASTPAATASQAAHPATLPEWMSPDRHVRYGPEQSCSRPFCKLKRKEHYHCNACNQAFSELERLRPHIAKHSTGALSPGTPLKREGAATPEDGNEDAGDQPSGTAMSGLPADHPAAMAMGGMTSQAAAQAAAMGGVALGLPPHAGMHGQVPSFAPHPFNAAMAAAVANQQLALMTSQGLPYLQHGMPAIYSSPSGLMFACTPSGFGAPHPLSANGLLDHRLDGVPGVGGVPGLHQHLALKRAMSPHILAGHQDMSPEAKKARIQNSMRILKDEPVPEGYIRFRFNEDCKYPHCGYREHQTHFHCMRQDCGYSFCDKTRFVQHTARHERLDTLMGGDFQQFRANVSCNRPDCVYTSTLGAMQNKASHFHCLKCEFVCTDTNKVVAHRRQHQKLDSIMAAGFEKFTPSQPCHSESCAHSGKQTHYHCLSCHYAVLGLSQMSAHKFRHMD